MHDIDFENDFEIADKQYQLLSKQQTIVDTPYLEVTTTGHAYDAIAIVLNKTDDTMYIDFMDIEDTLIIKPNDYCLLLMNEEGRAQLVQFLFANYSVNFQEEE